MAGEAVGSASPTPEPGQLVWLRDRWGVVRGVEAAQDAARVARVHLVDIEYLDGWRHPEGERVLWELEHHARVMSAVSLPRVSDSPDRPPLFYAYLDAVRWGSLARLEGVETDGGPSIVSPWHGCIQVEDYQLYPVYEALKMPWIRLLLADDVGLGKTIEAGLVATELIAQRHIKRILVVCPAALQLQWREEMGDKFNLDFTILDRAEVLNVQRTLGTDVNPWTSYPRIITSMDYLRHPDVLERFRAATDYGTKGQTPYRWDLLIVDEAHNMAPVRERLESRRSRMLLRIARNADHRLFLTATPHNGYTTSFTGLLQLLDPVRFQQRPSLTSEDRQQLQTIMVRRLKSELNREGFIPRFPRRHVRAMPIQLGPAEQALYSALREYRRGTWRLAGGTDERSRSIIRFLVSLLTKRLLSTSYAFARTWWAHVEGFDLERIALEQVEEAQRRVEADLSDDEEKGLRERDAARTTAAWLKTHADSQLAARANEVSQALRRLGWTEVSTAQAFCADTPLPADGRFEGLLRLIREHLMDAGRFRPDERLIVFTEYRDSLDYLTWRLGGCGKGFSHPELQSLHGGATLSDRETMKAAFNDPETPLRILAATDVASEGINLQTACRYVLHQEIPWNPMRLDQRNGRVDRHGQARDVVAFHFVCDAESDLEFLDRVVQKVEAVRESLGRVSPVLDERIMRYFTEGAGGDLADIGREAGPDPDLGPNPERDKTYEKAMQSLHTAQLRLGLTPSRLARVLAEALALDNGELRAEGNRYRIVKVPPKWECLIKDSLRIPKGPGRGALPGLVFDATCFEKEINGRRVFRPPGDAALLRLGHPVMRRALGELRKRMWGDGGDAKHGQLGRWVVVATEATQPYEVVLAVHCLLTATNELRETPHKEVLALAYSAAGDRLERLEAGLWGEVERGEVRELTPHELRQWVPRLRAQWPDYVGQLEREIESEREAWDGNLRRLLDRRRPEETEREKQAFEQRLKELEEVPRQDEKLLATKKKQLEKARGRADQKALWEDIEVEARDHLRQIEDEVTGLEWESRQRSLEELRHDLRQERDRLLEVVLPGRFALARVDLQPVAVEFRVRLGEVRLS